jgi:hypothetical protein
LNRGWTLLSGAGTIVSVSAGEPGKVVAVTTAGDSVWMYSGSAWKPTSSGSFGQVSASVSATNDDLFGRLTDGDLWEYTDGGWLWVLQGGVDAASTP